MDRTKTLSEKKLNFQGQHGPQRGSALSAQSDNFCTYAETPRGTRKAVLSSSRIVVSYQFRRNRGRELKPSNACGRRSASSNFRSTTKPLADCRCVRADPNASSRFVPVSAESRPGTEVKQRAWKKKREQQV